MIEAIKHCSGSSSRTHFNGSNLDNPALYEADASLIVADTEIAKDLV